jgi:hypothetical protein
MFDIQVRGNPNLNEVMANTQLDTQVRKGNPHPNEGPVRYPGKKR